MSEGTGRWPGVRRALADVALPIGVAAGWIGLEVLLRRGLVAELAPYVRSWFVADWAVVVVGFPLVAALLGWIAAKRGRAPGAWGYDWSLRPVLAGLAGIVATVAITAVTIQVDTILFSLRQVDAAYGVAVGDVVGATPAFAALFLLANGVIGPVTEEAVWRGIVQSELVDTRGALAGIALTAGLFAAKHVIVDLSVVRLTTLLALGLAFGALRHRYGTASSTVAHVGVNLLSSASIVAAALA